MFNSEHFLKQNPWRLDKTKLIGTGYLERAIWPDLVRALADDKPILLTGPRGSGKSTLLQLAIQYLVKEAYAPTSAIFYFNLDDLITRDGFTSTDEVVKFIQGFKPDRPQELWVFLDEVGHLAENRLEPLGFVRELQGRLERVKLILTSSVTHPYPSPRLGPAWRDVATQEGILTLEVGLVNYKEFLNRMLNPQNIFLPDGEHGQPKLKLPEKIGTLRQDSWGLTPLLDEYLRYGGYARVVQEFTGEKRPGLLQQVYQELFSGPLTVGKRPWDSGEQRKLLGELASAHGSVLNISKLSRRTKLNHKTILAYLDHLESSFLINKVYPYLPAKVGAVRQAGPEKSRAEKGSPLAYFNDNGLRNMLLDIFGPTETRPDRRILLDNFLYQGLRILPWVKEMYFWQSGTSEVTGFCFRYGIVWNLAGVLYDFPEVKAGRWALVNFGRQIKAKKVIILTRNESAYEKVGSSTVIYLPAVYAWLIPQILGG